MKLANKAYVIARVLTSVISVPAKNLMVQKDAGNIAPTVYDGQKEVV